MADLGRGAHVSCGSLSIAMLPGWGADLYNSGDLVAAQITFRNSGAISFSTYVSGITQWATPIKNGAGNIFTFELTRTSGLSFNIGNNFTGDMNVDIGPISVTGGAGSTTGNWTIRDAGGFSIASGELTVSNAF